MSEFPSATETIRLVSLLAPGLIIAAIRTRAITGSMPDLKDRLIAYAVISTAYFAVVHPLFNVTNGISISVWVADLLQNFIIPIVVGVCSAFVHQWEWSYKIANKVGLKLAHHLPTAWDYLFDSLVEETLVLISLNDGSQVAGKMTRNSFASSSADERDLFIQEVWEVPDNGDPWHPLIPARGILICGKDIRFIEVY
ncbi:DUF6338 family protein [Sphingomonas bacterium]|uniref:DUF6338 family protein n=1 Tax=Sphingomonas bacterium TaxID=1895847 RepID=UPI0015764C40|nr:DUF6338 family protein [Sphingomonas bacterium]